MRSRTIAVVGSGRAAKAIVAAARRAAVSRVALRRADVVILAVADRAIEEAALRLAEGRWDGRLVLHLSGAKGPAALASLEACGAVVGVLHPLTVFRESVPVAPRFYRLDGSRRFCAVAKRLASALWPESRELRTARRLDDRARGRYHAAAALVANDLAALLDGGASLLASVGLPRRAAERGLAALAEDALAAAAADGPRRGLTGPVVRGDVDTVRRHLEVLREVDPEIAEIHRRLSLRLVRIALEAKRIAAPRAAALRRVLGGPRGGRGV